MSLEDTVDLNIKASVQKVVHDHFELGWSYPVNYGDAGFKITPSMDVWVDVNWISFGRGPYTTNTLMFRCFNRPVNDRMGLRLEEMISRLREVLNRRTIPFLDFTADPSSPSPIVFEGEELEMAIRFEERGPLQSATGMARPENEGAMDGVEFVPLTYYVHVPRPNVIP